VSDNENSHGAEWDLAQIAANTTQGDAFLIDLIRLAENGIGTVIGVLANGMVMAGVVSTGQAIAIELDGQMRTLVGNASRPEDVSAESWQEHQRYWATRNADIYTEIEEKRKRLEETLDGRDWPKPNHAEPPGGIERERLENTVRTTLTLVNVQVSAPGQIGVLKTDVMRIAVSQIAGWWPIPVDSEGNASFRWFVAGDE
jgi:hypothetical protein